MEQHELLVGRRILKEAVRLARISHRVSYPGDASVFEHLMDQEVGEINYDSMHQLVFANTKLTPNPENKAEFLLYDKNDSGQEEEESQAETKLTGEMRASDSALCSERSTPASRNHPPETTMTFHLLHRFRRQKGRRIAPDAAARAV